MRRSAGFVWYAPVLLGLALSIVAAKADPATDAPSFNLYDNYDLSGDTSRTIKNSTASACADECKSDQTCRALSFNKDKKLCVLSTTVGALRFDPSVVGGLRSDVTMPAETDAAFEMSCTPKTAVLGVSLSRSNVPTLDKCADACEKNVDCVAFNFGNACTLLKTFESSAASPTGLSGIKRQRPTGDGVATGEACTELAHSVEDEAKKPMDTASLDRKNLIIVHQNCIIDNFADIVRHAKDFSTDPRTLALQKCDPELEKVKALIIKQTGNKDLADRTALTIQRSSMRGLEVALLNFFNERKK